MTARRARRKLEPRLPRKITGAAETYTGLILATLLFAQEETEDVSSKAEHGLGTRLRGTSHPGLSFRPRIRSALRAPPAGGRRACSPAGGTVARNLPPAEIRKNGLRLGRCRGRAAGSRGLCFRGEDLRSRTGRDVESC